MVLDASEMRGHLCRQLWRRGRRQQRCSRGVCAHREDGLEVVEQLDVLRDARAGPADHVVLAARGGRGGEEPTTAARRRAAGLELSASPCSRGPARQRLLASTPRANTTPWAGAPRPRASCHCAEPSSDQWPQSQRTDRQREAASPALPAAGSALALWAHRLTGPSLRAMLSPWYPESEPPTAAAGRSVRGSTSPHTEGPRRVEHTPPHAAGATGCPTGHGCTHGTLLANPPAPEGTALGESAASLLLPSWGAAGLDRISPGLRDVGYEGAGAALRSADQSREAAGSSRTGPWPSRRQGWAAGPCAPGPHLIMRCSPGSYSAMKSCASSPMLQTKLRTQR